ncbi:cobalamin adenosyltransferase [Sphingopyxis lindanitolerans]|uniref:Cobalamin adenosyltransferase n=1 Tax=Sphingopyxis lindanitolerans TaxID=2054227 RepID=A0A2S8B3B5_9SPHN|nr:heme-binding protein [Sphingopyxis lindanitolerans]PQM26901.1 cobalamin adenosyltransferase [Sphingopyxis lindanitolerans]
MAHSRSINTISAACARQLTDAAAAAAAEIGVPMCIAITCAAGNLLHFLRMDGAPLLSSDIAINKAYTAAGFGMATHAWHEFIKDDPPLLHGIVHTDRLVTFGGGYPIREGKAMIGGIGISGGHYSQDMDVATKALAAIGLAAG